MIDKDKLTPMMKQYMEIKENTKDALVFYRLGDFYELFFEDAITTSKALDLVLTARSAGGEQKAPMCGVPHHAAKSYIQKLINQGFKVAIVEQVEDPKEAKGIVRREVVEIITPGTFIENEETLTSEIASIHKDLVYATLVICNLTSGSVKAVRVMSDNLEIIKTLQQYQVSELVVDAHFDPQTLKDIKDKTEIIISYETDLDSNIHNKDKALETALQRLYGYLFTTQKRTLNHLQEVTFLNNQAYLKMDFSSISNLELIQQASSKDLSLYSFINKTVTHVGARLLKEELMRPMVSKDNIIKRQEEIEYFMSRRVLSDEIQDLLKQTYDIHRVIARLATGKNNAQDFVRLKKTLAKFKEIQALLLEETFAFVYEQDPLDSLFQLLDEAIYDDAPVQFKEGRTFKPGVDETLDGLLDITQNGKQWLLEYEEKQRQITGIKNLKVGYTRAFGYYIEITKGQIENVSDEFGYIRKQTLTNAERYISSELQDYEVKVLQASDRILEIEQELFRRYTEYTKAYIQEIHNIGSVLAKLDVILSMMRIASYPGYVKPTFHEESTLILVEGRHPVLESELRSHQYISSDAIFEEDAKLHILTGPNMGGKSTYMRMVALNIIMAQMGMHVPAKEAHFPIIDQIFTRMGASDDILMGQSTFMVEMLEAQTALTHATKHSLVLFDEIGRGTSTYDGMALAQAILEYIVYNIGCITIFSTHYHELTALETMHEGIKNVHVDVYENGDEVTFLYQVIDGKADRSYGINVARLAHLPKAVLDRANENLKILEATKSSLDLVDKTVVIETQPQDYVQMKQLLERIDVNRITPLEALTIVSELKKLGDEE